MSELVEAVAESRTVRIRPTGPAPAPSRAQKREILAEQQQDWLAGRPAPPEAYLARWPTDPKGDPDAATIIVADYLERRERGEQPSLHDYQERLPEHSRTLVSLIQREDLIRTLGGKRRRHDALLGLPGVGEELFGFRLRYPLGQGAFARVFIAEQPDLASRPVVLKISAIEGIEPQTLARLQHTNIVPIYSVHEDSRAGLRAVCMPYFGGASLASVLKQLWSETDRPTQCAEFLRAL